ncbi:MAG: DUF4276 family protein [Candidatus Methanospirare jalkutatii]|nr:MAG: DUF4276 family protein [Candidatus Methanospirare jalkutatii]UYZ40202.1 MAG: DUF4276 family protein [Candidatus Methanospirare jalkutatii]
MKKVGLVVEDKYPEAIKEISKKLGVKPIIRRQRGKISVKEASAFAKELLVNCEKVIILGDADCNEEGERERLQRIYGLLPEGLRERVHICIVVHELESWLLADENAISKRLGKNVRAVPNPESIHDAKEYLEELFEEAGEKYLTKFGGEIAKHVNVEKLKEKCASFADFERKVRNGNVRRRDA